MQKFHHFFASQLPFINSIKYLLVIKNFFRYFNGLVEPTVRFLQNLDLNNLVEKMNYIFILVL
jgi:hypothetical protein